MTKVLVDTQVFLWWAWDAPHLSARAKALLRNPDHELRLSLVSAWEIAIKVSIGKLQLTESVEKFIPEQLQANDISLLGIDFRHVAKVAVLPWHHRDPFDRLLISQALVEGLPLLSADKAFDPYGIERLW